MRHGHLNEIVAARQISSHNPSGMEYSCSKVHLSSAVALRTPPTFAGAL
jgi:hypothetical protein